MAGARVGKAVVEGGFVGWLKLRGEAMNAGIRSVFRAWRAVRGSWRTTRNVPARVQVALLSATAICLGGLLTAWVVVPAPVQAGAVGESAYDQVHRLRTAEKNLSVAEAVALDFLAAHPDLDVERQQVYFEYGLTLFDAQKWSEASSAFRSLAAEYVGTRLDVLSPEFCVDDAAYFAAVTEHYHGDKSKGIELYREMLSGYPQSPRCPKALLLLAGAYEQTAAPAAALPVFERLASEYAESEYAPEAQIHVGHIRLQNGDYLGAVAAFESLVRRWPESRHAPTALMMLGGAHERAGNVAGALTSFERVADVYPDSESASEALMQIGHLHLRTQDYVAAADVFDEVVLRWPQSRHAPTALQFANRARIHSDLSLWATGTGPGDGGARNAAAIESNLDRMLANYGQDGGAPAVMLDAVNYYAPTDWWRSGVGVDARARLKTLCERLIALYPDSREAWQARLELAQAISHDEPERALAMADAAVADARSHQDASRYISALFTRGSLLLNAGRTVEARVAYETLLASAPEPLVVGETQIDIASSLIAEGRYEAADLMLGAVCVDERFPDDVCAAAMVLRADALVLVGQTADAVSVLKDVVTRFPDTPSREAAQIELVRLGFGM